MSNAKRVIEFVDGMLIPLIVKRVKWEQSTPGPWHARETYYCECCDSEAVTEQEIEHSDVCEIAKWEAFKREIENAETQ